MRKREICKHTRKGAKIATEYTNHLARGYTAPRRCDISQKWLNSEQFNHFCEALITNPAISGKLRYFLSGTPQLVKISSVGEKRSIIHGGNWYTFIACLQDSIVPANACTMES